MNTVVFNKAWTDFWTYFLVGIAGMTIVFPSSDWKGWGVSTGLAVGGIVVNALRRVILGSSSSSK